MEGNSYQETGVSVLIDPKMERIPLRKKEELREHQALVKQAAARIKKRPEELEGMRNVDLRNI